MSIEAIIDKLKEAPENQIDPVIRKDIEGWGYDVAPLDVLRVLDKCVCYAGASGVAIQVLDMVLNHRIAAVGTTREEVVASAPWRQSGDFP